MKLLGAIFLLWLPFSVAALIAIPVCLFGVLFNIERIWRPVGRAMDRLMATLFGFSGEYTLSAELALTGRYALLRSFLDLIETDHCRKAAEREGAL